MCLSANQIAQILAIRGLPLELALCGSATESNPTARVNENILPLQLERTKTVPKDQTVVFKLRTDPADAASPTYMMMMNILNGTEGCRAAIKFVSDLETVCTGLNVNVADVATRRTTAFRVLTGQAKTAYDVGFNARQEARHETARNAVRRAGANAGGTNAQFAARIVGVGMPNPDASTHLCNTLFPAGSTSSPVTS